MKTITLSDKTFNSFIETIPKCKPIAVFGDIGLDTYLNGEVSRISPEAPVIVVNTTNVEQMIGLAGNVSNNLTKLGVNTKLFSIIGKDMIGVDLHKLLCENYLDCYLLTDPDRPTTHKKRIMGGNQHVCRVDTEKSTPINQTLKDQLLDKFLKEIDDYGAIIIQDYNKGLFDFEFTQSLISVANSKKIPTFVDPHPKQNWDIYSNATFLKPNINEAKSLLGDQYCNKMLCNQMQDLLDIDNIILTMGKHGMWLQNDRTFNHLLPTSNNVIEVAGAGDTVISLFSIGILAGLTFQEAGIISNIAAGIVISKKGTSTLDVNELRTAFNAWESK